MSDRLQALLKLHQADPQDPFCTYGVALEHAKAGQTDQALGWLDKTIALDAHYTYAYYQKARCLAQKGDTAGARAALRSGLARIKPDARDAEKARAELQQLLDTLG